MVRSIQELEAEIADEEQILSNKRIVCDELALGIRAKRAALDDLKRSRAASGVDGAATA